MPNPVILTIEEYQRLSDDMEGVCKECGAIRSCVEPDAEHYPCEECGENAVMGPDWYLFAGGVQ